MWLQEQNSVVQHIAANQHHSTLQTLRQRVRREWDLTYFFYFLKKRGWLCAFLVSFCPARSQAGEASRLHLFIAFWEVATGDKVNTLLQTRRPSFPAAHTYSQSPGKITDRLYGVYTFLGHGCQHMLVVSSQNTHSHKLISYINQAIYSFINESIDFWHDYIYI